MIRRVLMVLWLSTLAGCDPCGDVVVHIEALSAGESYVVPTECVVSEPFTVPSGARVEGGTFALDDASITLVPSSDASLATTLEGATLRGGNASQPLLVARGAGHVAIRTSSFHVERGIAIGISGASAELVGVSIDGNLDPARGAEVPAPVDPETLATFGVAVIDGAAVELRDVSVRRVAAGGLVCSSASLAIDGATFEECLGLGVWADACTGTLDGVEVHDLVTAPLRPGIGIASRASTFSADGLHVHDAPGYAMVAIGSDVTLGAPRIERLRQSGIWAEDGARLTITSGIFDENRGAAIAAAGVALLEVEGTTVRNTALAPIPTADGTSFDRIGDGIHLAQLSGRDTEVVLTDVVLVDNARVGAVMDGDMRALALTLTNVRVESSGTELGVTAQNIAGLPASWDADVTRVGSAAALDATAGAILVSTGGLDGILMPPTIVF